MERSHLLDRILGMGILARFSLDVNAAPLPIIGFIPWTETSDGVAQATIASTTLPEPGLALFLPLGLLLLLRRPMRRSRPAFEKFG